MRKKPGFLERVFDVSDYDMIHDWFLQIKIFIL